MSRTLSTDGSMMNLAESDGRNYSKRTLSFFFFFRKSNLDLAMESPVGEIGRIANDKCLIKFVFAEEVY